MQAQTTSTAPDRSRLQSLAPIAVFDVLGPLVVYVIIQTSSAGTAKATSNFMPLVVATVVIAWNVCYAKRGRRRGRLADSPG